MTRLFISLLICCTIFSGNVFAQTEPDKKTPETQARKLLYLIYDSSNSMWGELSDKSRKYQSGRTAMSSVLDLKLDDRDLAFRAYGHRDKTDCRDSELIVTASSPKIAKPAIKKAVTRIRPTGKTPISYSLREGLKDIGDRQGDILLISDGIETCDIDPCELMEEWRNQGVKIRVHVVGVGLNEIERAAMACVAQTGGGKYFDAGSEAELIEAMNEAVKVEPGEATPVEHAGRYALIIRGKDETGRSFRMTGTHALNNKDLGEITSNGRYGVDGPGDYTIEAGPLLKDGTAYKPIQKQVSVTETGDTVVDFKVVRPAIVSASFSEDGEDHKGSHVTAYQNGKEVFSFRAFDEALAHPGNYEFRATPNKDNEISVDATLAEGEHTVLDFKLVKTIKVRVEYKLPNGEIITRGGRLFKDGEEVYPLYSGNWTTAKPGRYEVRSADTKLALPGPVYVEFDADKQTRVLDLPAGFLTIVYEGAETDLLNEPDRAFYHPYNPKTKKFLARHFGHTNVAIPVTPGHYKLVAHYNSGYFDPVEFDIANNESKTVSLIAKPTASISVTYAAAEYARKPDRASLVPLDGQKPIKTFMRPGKVLKVPPGRYRIKPHGVPGMKPIEFELTAGEIKAAVLK